MMARANSNTSRMDDLLASVTGDLLGDLPQAFTDNSIRVERILLEMERPDPVQPRRVLPESIHLRFHNNRVTPAQALRELVQIVQIAARQRGRLFNNVLELLSNADMEGHTETMMEMFDAPRRLERELRGDGKLIVYNPAQLVSATSFNNLSSCVPNAFLSAAKETRNGQPVAILVVTAPSDVRTYNVSGSFIGGLPTGEYLVMYAQNNSTPGSATTLFVVNADAVNHYLIASTTAQGFAYNGSYDARTASIKDGYASSRAFGW